MDNDPYLIHLDDIHFSYPNAGPVLNGACFHLEKGERVGLIGPNGSGKTSLFHVIMGLYTPDIGTVRLFGDRMENEDQFKKMRPRIGMLFQDPDDQLFSPTVIEDVAFGPLNQGKTVKEAKRIAQDTLHSLGLSGFEDRVTYKLSGGEKRLVSFATVLSMKPEVLLLDEPTNGLDSVTTEKLIQILNQLQLSYVFISHNMDFLFQTTDKIYGLINGRIVSEAEAAPHSHVHTHDFGRLSHIHSTTDKPNTEN